MKSAQVVLIRTTTEKLNSIPILDGQFLVVRNKDTNENEYLAYDDANGRHIVNQFVDLDTELEKERITPSKSKYYFVKETEKLYRYINNEWICLNSEHIPDAHVVQVDAVINLPTIGDKYTVYFIQSINKTYYWNENENFYYCAGSDWHDIETVDANFTN